MTTPAAPAAAPKGRLGNGQLRRQVAEYLTDHPGPCKTGEIAKALDRSAGAVGNALTTLAGNGSVAARCLCLSRGNDRDLGHWHGDAAAHERRTIPTDFLFCTIYLFRLGFLRRPGKARPQGAALGAGNDVALDHSLPLVPRPEKVAGGPLPFRRSGNPPFYSRLAARPPGSPPR